MRVFNQIAIFFLKIYQKIPIPGMHQACRFLPTCSHYAVGCYENYSFFYASYLTSRRLLRCHPFCEGGLDPVPKRRDRS